MFLWDEHIYLGIRTIPLDISPGHFPRMNRAILAKLTVINPTSIVTDRTISINPTSISTKNVFHQM